MLPRIGLLVVTNLSKISPSLQAAAQKYLFKTLYVQVHSPGLQHFPLPTFSNIISKIYSSSLCHCQGTDVRVVVENLRSNKSKKFNKKIDVLLFDNCFSTSDTASKMSISYNSPKIIELGVNQMDTEQLDIEKMKGEKSDKEEYSLMYDNVVLGGTFDRLHEGHKILLTEAVLRTKKRLVVGVTDENMVKSKKLKELILPIQERIDNVRDFLQDIDNTVQYEVVPIADAYGPTKWDPNLDLLIVSVETMRGGESVNRVRSEGNLSPLSIHCIDLIETETSDSLKELKISSSNNRLDLLGLPIRKRIDRPYLLERPYIIGLVGGIATGKSDMSKRFEKLGAAVIDCDKLAHQLYEPGRECFEKIVQCFGNGIVDANGQINRKILGEIVFSNASDLMKLNAIVWPSLLTYIKEKIAILYKETKCEVVILEAAILLKAGWQTECHEIWSTILPKEEAAARLMKRNNLTEDQAKKRIESQDSNEVIVTQSDVVFSSQYGLDFSQIQAERAWKALMERIKEKAIQPGKL